MGKPSMSPKQLRTALGELGLSQMGAARFFDVNPRTMRAYVSGEYVVPEMMAKFIRLMVRRNIRPETDPAFTQ